MRPEAGILDLDDFCLAEIFKLVDSRERCTRLPAVCNAFYLALRASGKPHGLEAEICFTGVAAVPLG